MSVHFLRRSARRYAINESGANFFIHPTALDWANRVVTNGASYPSAATVAAVSVFCSAMDSAGITSLMKAVCCMTPANLTEALTPLIKAVGVDPWVQDNFVAGDLTTSGLKGNGSTKRVRPGITANTTFASVNDCGITLYNTFSDNSINSRDFAGRNTVNQSSELLTDWANNYYFDAYHETTGRVTAATPLTGGQGFTSGNRTGAANQVVYTASSVSAFTSSANNAGSPGASLPTFEYYMFAMNDGGVSVNYSAKRFSFAAVHSGLSSSQCQAFYNAVQALRTALGGGYI